MKKTLSFVLALVFLLSAVPAAVFAAEERREIVAISASDMEIEQYTNGEWVYQYFDESGEIVSLGFEDGFFSYVPRPEKVTLYYNDGTELIVGINDLKSTAESAWEIEGYPRVPEDQLEVGESHQFTLKLESGLSCTFNVTVIPNRVDHIEVGEIVIAEEDGGSWTREEDENGVPVSPWYFRYNWYWAIGDVTVYYKDGTSENIDRRQSRLFDMIGSRAAIEDSQDTFEGRWDAGSHTGTLLLGAFTCECTITIVPSSREKAVFSLTSAKGKPGDTVTLELTFEENPGVFGIWSLLVYDPALDLIDVEYHGMEEYGEFIGGQRNLTWFGKVASPYDQWRELTFSLLEIKGIKTMFKRYAPIMYENYSITENCTYEGAFATLTFRIPEGAAAGTEYDLYYLATHDNCIGLEDDEEYDLVCPPAKITVLPEHEVGDVNGDGEVDMKDVLLLRRIVAGAEDVTNGADVNGDGGVDLKDVLMLRRMIAGIE